MRKISFFEAYIDRPDTINVYMSELHYQGISTFFYLMDNQDETTMVDIVNTSVGVDHYHYYQCRMSKPLAFGRTYRLCDSHGRSTPLRYGLVIKSDDFNQRFTTDRTLGASVNGGTTTFTVWSPVSSSVSLFLFDPKGERSVYLMNANTDGTFSLVLHQNCDGLRYYYVAHNNGKMRQFLDPYGIAQTPNSRYSVVVDVSQLKTNKVVVPPLTHPNQAVIYEANIRDLTPQHTFKALCHEYRSTLEYIKSLGVTHLQIMPIFDYGSVDETNVKAIYNWGYDVQSWFTLEGSYSSNVYEPTQVMQDFIEFVNTCHSIGLKVVVDVVYNHVFELKDSCYYQCCPYYFFQIDEMENVSNSSMCGNDVNTTMPMVRRTILDSVRQLFSLYDVDGLRLDLMGIMDVDTVNEIATVARRYKSDALIYGEGWNMPSFLAENKRACIANAAKMPMVGFFSDVARDAIKGNLYGSNFEPGFACGNGQAMYKCMNALQASVTDFGFHKVFVNSAQPINYVECHDNMTVYDQYTRFMNEKDERVLKRCLLSLAFVIFAQGVSFIHSGQEFGRTKKGIDNSYDKGDEINHFDYGLRDERMWMVDYVRNMVSLRHKYSHFHLDVDDKLGTKIFFEHVNNQILMYEIDADDSTMIIFFNPTYHTFHYHFQNSVTRIFAEDGSLDEVSGLTDVEVSPISCSVYLVNSK